MQVLPETEVTSIAARVWQKVAKLACLIAHRGRPSRLRLAAASYGDSVHFLPKEKTGSAEQGLLRVIFGNQRYEDGRHTFAEFLQLAVARFLQEHEQMEPESTATQAIGQHAWEMQFDSPLISAAVERLLGSYLLIGADGRMTLGVLAIDTVPCKPPPVRYVLQTEGPLVDLSAGVASNERLSQAGLVQLLAGAVPELPAITNHSPSHPSQRPPA